MAGLAPRICFAFRPCRSRSGGSRQESRFSLAASACRRVPLAVQGSPTRRLRLRRSPPPVQLRRQHSLARERFRPTDAVLSSTLQTTFVPLQARAQASPFFGTTSMCFRVADHALPTLWWAAPRRIELPPITRAAPASDRIDRRQLLLPVDMSSTAQPTWTSTWHSSAASPIPDRPRFAPSWSQSGGRSRQGAAPLGSTAQWPSAWLRYPASAPRGPTPPVLGARTARSCGSSCGRAAWQRHTRARRAAPAGWRTCGAVRGK